MRTDILFDTVTRELVLTNGDFTITSNASVQNGNIILYSHGAIFRTPTLGIGAEQFINNSLDKVAKEMNRWKSQVTADGGNATYTTVFDEITNEVTIDNKVNYE